MPRFVSFQYYPKQPEFAVKARLTKRLVCGQYLATFILTAAACCNNMNVVAQR